MSNDQTNRVRLDRWLWAARFFKTRSLAAEAIDGGKVDVNGDGARRSKLIAEGDTVQVRVNQDRWTVTVRALSERRGPAREARELYEELEESRTAREALIEARRLGAPTFSYDEGKPSKKDRRALRKLRGD